MFELNGKRYEYFADIEDLLYARNSQLSVNDIVKVHKNGSITEKRISELIVDNVWSALGIECTTGKLAKWQNRQRGNDND